MATLIERSTIVKALEFTIGEFATLANEYDKWESKQERLQDTYDTAREAIVEWLKDAPIRYAEWDVSDTSHRYGESTDLYIAPAYGSDQVKPTVPEKLKKKFIAAGDALAQHARNRPVAVAPAEVAELRAYLLKYQTATGATVSVPDKVLDLLPNNAPLGV